MACDLPRACGGVPATKALSARKRLFTPRLRGCSQFAVDHLQGHPIYPAPAGVYPISKIRACQDADLPRACGDVPASQKGEDPINSRSPQHGAVPTRHLLNLPMQLPRVGADNGKTRSIRKTVMQIYYRPIPKCIFEFERIRFSTLVFFKPTLVSSHARCCPPAEPRKPVSPYASIPRSRGREITNLVVLCSFCNYRKYPPCARRVSIIL